MPTPNYVAQAPTMNMIDETQTRLKALETSREADRLRINALEKKVEELQSALKAHEPTTKAADEAFLKKAKG